MTTSHGKNGIVKIGSNTLAELTEFSWETSAETADDTAMGDAWNTHLIGQKSWRGQATCNFDSSDTNGQVALAEGASLTFNLYPLGAATSTKYKTGTATVTKVAPSVPLRNKIAVTFSFEGNGALADATVP